MSEGELHEFDDGYSFTETLCGPFIKAICVDCSKGTLAIPKYPSPRCGPCLRDHHGARVEVYGKHLVDYGVAEEYNVGKGKWLRLGPGLSGDVQPKAHELERPEAKPLGLPLKPRQRRKSNV